jgi:hypothetical protein
MDKDFSMQDPVLAIRREWVAYTGCDRKRTWHVVMALPRAFVCSSQDQDCFSTGCAVAVVTSQVQGGQTRQAQDAQADAHAGGWYETLQEYTFLF